MNKIDSSSKALYLTANENILSKTASSYLNSDLTNRYFQRKITNELDEKNRILIKENKNLDEIIENSEKILNNLLNVNYCDFSPLSGLHATISTIATCTNPGDVILTIDPDFCGHFATRNLIQHLGRKHDYIPWCKESICFDLNLFEQLVNKNKPRMIFLDHSSPINELPIKAIRKIIGINSLLVYDFSHVFGLIIGNCFQNPIHDGCDILQGNTHKTFPGPPKGIIAFKDREFGKYISRKISSSMVSNIHIHHMLALYISILEMNEFGVVYARQIIENQQYFVEYMEKESIKTSFSINPVSKTHIAFIDFGLDTQYLYEKLNNSLIATNYKKIYNKNLIRLGFQEVTRMGFKKEEILNLASLVYKSVINEISINNVKDEVLKILDSFNHVHFSFDELAII